MEGLNLEIEIIIKELGEIISKELDLAIGIEKKAESTLLELGMDSITLIQLMILIEEKYDIETSEDDLLIEFNTLGEIATYVSSKV